MSDRSSAAEPRQETGGPAKRKKRTALVVCAGDSTFWTTPGQFWRWVREGVVTYCGDDPLTGRFEGRREKLIVTWEAALDRAKNGAA